MVNANGVKKVERNRHANHFWRCHWHRYKRISKKTWRKPKGIDSVLRRCWRGQPSMPSIGFATSKKFKNVHPDRLKHFIVKNDKDLDMLLMSSNKYGAVIASQCGIMNRKKIVEKAKAKGIHVVNANARLRAEEE
eukprot:NODE_840_length_680_cov_691.738510_g770_i0.p2 GENE.NODE_840_length_680_cov_691.738510_g770_i0~~NODE_840_length_680_cov_691.738510_g770_i0.p2  ORF type:complete len:135 (-),score=32.45 NODE_840_length_680_cov_691.738510_g770_i0:194-598(-)